MPTENIFSHVKLYGERLGVVELSEGELPIPEGLIVPDTALKQHYFVRVVAKGDGVWRGSYLEKRSIPDVDVGDIVMVQMNPQLTNMYQVRDRQMVVMHWGDALAKVTDPTVPLSTKTVLPVGKWVFADVRLTTKADNIWLPDDSGAASISTFLVSSGSMSGIPNAEGSRVYIDMSKASPFSLGDAKELELIPTVEGQAKKRKLAYISCDYVLGIYEDVE